MRIVIMEYNKYIKALPVTIFLIIIITLALFFLTPNNDEKSFDGENAYLDVKYQVDLGARIPGSKAHAKAAAWISTRLEELNWQVELQETEISGIPVKNIIAKKGTGKPWIIIGSHYDSRANADRDPSPDGRLLPVPGANDGASSTAVLLELARTIPENPGKEIWLVFFDAEDISGNAIAIGSQYFVDQLDNRPDYVVILDMIGDKDLDIYFEYNSNPELNQEIWSVASSLGYRQFIPKYKYSLTDDHTPFLMKGIEAVDIIDFDYAYWHTTQDTLDKISADSLDMVGKVVLKWLELYP